MIRTHIPDLPIATNICEQTLREVGRFTGRWSVAHVVMNPLTYSLLHEHRKTDEIYIITKGSGELWLGDPAAGGTYHQVASGSVHAVRAGVPHMLRNNSASHLEHLVLALPPFDPQDIVVRDDELPENSVPLQLPEVQDCFDGARILEYAFPYLDVSVAFGWVRSDPERRRVPHYHLRTTEFIFIVAGKGDIVVGDVRYPVCPGDWIRINPSTDHAFSNKSPEDMVVVCVCTPAFSAEDVHYQK